MQGKIKWFSNQKGYGFVTPDGEEKDLFVHYSAIQADGYKSLQQGDTISFDIVTGPKGQQAGNVKVIKSSK